MGCDEDRKVRPSISPDDNDAHRAIVVSPAMLEAIAWEWYQHGIASTGEIVNGESDVIHDHEMRALIREAFRRLWARRNER